MYMLKPMSNSPAQGHSMSKKRKPCRVRSLVISEERMDRNADLSGHDFCMKGIQMVDLVLLNRLEALLDET